MKMKEALKLLSQVNVGAVVISEDTVIIEANDAADRMLHGDGKLVGDYLDSIAPILCKTEGPLQYENIAFNEYLIKEDTPAVTGLPEGSRMVTFRDATKDACHDLLTGLLTQLGDQIAIYDAAGRLWMLNDAAIEMEAADLKQVIGKRVDELYEMIDGTELMIPKVLKEKKPQFDIRAQYTTKYGKIMDVVHNDYPVLRNDQLLGAVCYMRDWSTVDLLTKQVIDLQEQLKNSTGSNRKQSLSVTGAHYHFDDILHMNLTMHNIIGQCRLVAKTDSPVMFYGETGTGKELFAQSIHNASDRANGPFLAINCAAIPENLLESMLFGTKKGAYTGAENRPGLFEQADGGTLLLDEINSMNINLQAKLLRVLQEGVVRRVGDTQEVKIDVRVISNINIPPLQAIAENKLRRDLFYRLGVVNINILPLRERKEDILFLAKQFIIRYNKKMQKNVQWVDEECAQIFETYTWPGNVRELQHAIEHAMILMPVTEMVISKEYLPDFLQKASEKLTQEDYIAPGIPEVQYLDPHEIAKEEMRAREARETKPKKMDRNQMIDVLRQNDWNISAAARALDISRQNLQYRIRKFKIDVKALSEEEKNKK